VDKKKKQKKLVAVVELDVIKVFKSQFDIDNQFTRYDTLVRFCVACNFLGIMPGLIKTATPVKELYIKMQRGRTSVPLSRATVMYSNFLRLVQSIAEDGLNQKYPITVCESLSLIDGSHRLATALALNIPTIGVKIADKCKDRQIYVAYGRDVLQAMEILEADLCCLDTVLEEICNVRDV
jgi:hypothetical protein